MAVKKGTGKVVYERGSVVTRNGKKPIESQQDAWKEDADCGCGIDCCLYAYVTYDRVLQESIYYVSENKQLLGFTRAELMARNADTVFPTFVSAVVENATKTKLEITFSEALNPAFVPAIAAVAASGKTVTLVEVAGNKMTLTVSVAYASGNVITTSYTQPATNKLQDLNGHYVASYVTQPVTNNVA